MPDRPLRIMYPASMRTGGAERQMVLLAKYLPRDRFDVSFVILGSTTPLAEEARTYGATIHALGIPRRADVSAAMLPVHAGRAIAAYAAASRRGHYDVVDAWLYHGYWLAGLTRPVARVPVLVAGRRSLSAFKASWNPLWRTFDALARRRSDVIVANSQAVATDVAAREGIDRGRIRVIRNGVEIPPPPGPAARARARVALGVATEVLVVGCVGSFKRGKGQAAVVHAMRDVVKQVPNASVVFVGDGPERASVERLAASEGLQRVHFTGDVPDARPLFAGFDVVVSASDAEGLPNVILEAASSGLPVVATDAGGTNEIITDGESGILVPVGDVAGLTAGLVRVLEDPHLGQRLGAAGRDHVERTFGIDRFVAETAALYEELAGRADH